MILKFLMDTHSYQPGTPCTTSNPKLHLTVESDFSKPLFSMWLPNARPMIGPGLAVPHHIIYPKDSGTQPTLVCSWHGPQWLFSRRRWTPNLLVICALFTMVNRRFNTKYFAHFPLILTNKLLNLILNTICFAK